MTRSVLGPQYITPHVFARRLQDRGIKISVRTVREWCSRGDLRSKKIARSHWILDSEVDRVVDINADPLDSESPMDVDVG